MAYPAVAELALRVNSVGRSSSVVYEVGIFENGKDAVRAVGELIHVFVDRESGKPSVDGMQSSIRQALLTIMATNLNSKI